MNTIIFDGAAFATHQLHILSQHVQNTKCRLVSVVFEEDGPSQVYTRLKHEAAVQVGIEFDRIDHSLHDQISLIQHSIHLACKRADVTGVMIQKPGKRAWAQVTGKSPARFDDWWRELTAAIDPAKDVDCLTRTNLNLVYEGNPRVLPATVKAVLAILQEALDSHIHFECERDGCSGSEDHELEESSATGLLHQSKAEEPSSAQLLRQVKIRNLKIVVIGRSELVGRPLASVLSYQGAAVQLLGSADYLTSRTQQADVIVSATGRRGLITGEMVKTSAIVIDVGAPGADIEFDTVAPKASFITPVPNGVGPVTVACLLENLVQLSQK